MNSTLLRLTRNGRTRTLLARALATSFALVLATACVSTDSSVKTGAKGKGPWLDPSPALRSQIEDKAKRLPWTHGLERVEMIQWFAGVGEPAYPTLLTLARDPRADVSGAAFAALGATRDSRLVDYLRELPLATGPESTDLNLERARTLLRLGDWHSIPDLIAGLKDERVITRALAIQALYEATHEKFDYDPRGDPAAREVSIQRWNSWWESRRQDPLLFDDKKPAPSKAQE
jgi:hypothetical protein